MPDKCCFCDKLSKSTGFSCTLRTIDPWDYVLYSSRNFIVVPTVGALVEGWLMIISKNHYVCMGALPYDLFSELEYLSQFIASKLEMYYGNIVLFEHGPSIPNQSLGCGVDHAHLHLVPTNYNLINGISTVFAEKLDWNRLNNISGTSDYFKKQMPYLYVEQPLANPYITSHVNLGSQLFRRVIANQLGIPNRYNWRHFPEKDNVIRTIHTLKPIFETSKKMTIATTYVPL